MKNALKLSSYRIAVITPIKSEPLYSFEFGKTRLIVIFQTDKLNYAVQEGIYDYFVVIPISTMDDIVTDEFRLKILPREKLEKTCFVVCNSFVF